MEERKVDVSIVLITWKMKDMLKVCLDTIIKFTKGVTYEIILVENYSNDGTTEMIELDYPEIMLVKNSENMGVAPARNQGLKLANGKYALILDVDMELFEDTIYKLFYFMENNLDVGLVGSKLVDSDGSLQYSCKRFPKLSTLFLRRIDFLNTVKNSKNLKNHLMIDYDHKEIMDVDYVIGACQFIRREALVKTGLYDDQIFYGPEDLDMCYKMWQNNYKVFYYPKTKIFHHEQRITKKNIFSKITVKHFFAILYLFKKYNWKISRKK